MKKLLTLFAVAAFAASMTNSFAQGAGPKTGGQGSGAAKGQGQGQRGPGQGQDRAAMMKKFAEAKAKILADLKLSKDQMAKLKAADDKQEAAMKKMRDSMQQNRGQQQDEATRKKNREAMMKVRTEHQDTYKKVMGADKFKKYEEAWQKWMKDNGFQGRGPGGQGGPGGRGGAAGAGKAGGGGKKPPTF